MRWIFIILSVIGLGYICKLYFATQIAKVAFVAPGFHWQITYGMLLFGLFAGLATAKLKWGK